MVSVKRLSAFFGADELQPDARIIKENKKLELGDEVLTITHADLAWTKDAPSPILEDISLTVRRGELVGVLGRVGAGKVRALSGIEVLKVGNDALARRACWVQSLER